MGSSIMRRRVLVIAGLSTLAVVWPILDIFGRNPEVFVANRTSAWQMVGFALLVGLAVPVLASLLVWSFEQLSPRAGLIGYGAVVAVLSAAIGLVVARQITQALWLTLLPVRSPKPFGSRCCWWHSCSIWCGW